MPDVQVIGEHYDDIPHLIKKEVVDRMKRYSEAAGMPQDFTDGIRLLRKGKKEMVIINDWSIINQYGDKVDMADIFEFGTRKNYWIGPRIKKRLMWWEYTPRDTGDVEKHQVFSSGYYHPGKKPSYAMRKGFDKAWKYVETALRKGENRLAKERPYTAKHRPMSLMRGEKYIEKRAWEYARALKEEKDELDGFLQKFEVGSRSMVGGY